MSLIRPAVRACVVAALKDKTWAAGRVFDSDMTALAEAVVGGPPQPYIVVYTDNDDRPRGMGAEMYDGEARQMNIVLEIGIASSIQVTQGQYQLQFAATDSGMELACDMVEHQCIAALWGDPYSTWGEILKKLCWRITRTPSRRGGQAQAGIRFAARRTTFVVSTMYDIPPGVALDTTHPLMQFITAAIDPINISFGIGAVGMTLQKMLDGSANPDWRQAQAYLGMTKDSVVALNVPGSPLPYPELETPPLDYSDTNEFAPQLGPDDSDIGLDGESLMSDLVTGPGAWPPPQFL